MRRQSLALVVIEDSVRGLLGEQISIAVTGDGIRSIEPPKGAALQRWA